MKRAAIVAAVMAGMAISAPPAAAQGVCIAGIFIAAFYANATENRELTAKEAATCGLFYGADVKKPEPAAKPVAARTAKPKPKKTAAKSRKQ